MSNQSGGNLDSLVATFISGYLGYVAGSRKLAGWEPIIKNYETRMSHLAYFKIVRPVTFLNTVETSPIIYTEAILAFLFGLPNASVPTTLRCLELGLKHKYTTETGQTAPDRLYELIEWAEEYLRDRKEIAHGFRILRNLVHSPTVVSEQSALEAISHVTAILNLLYILPPQITTVNENYLGNIFAANCYSCHQPTSILILGSVI
jgi:hypothetical protein